MVSMFIPNYRDLRRRRVPPPGVVFAPLAARRRSFRAGRMMSSGPSAQRPDRHPPRKPCRAVLKCSTPRFSFQDGILSASEIVIAYVKRTGQFILSHSADRSLKTIWCFVLACSMGDVDPRLRQRRRRSRGRRHAASHVTSPSMTRRDRDVSGPRNASGRRSHVSFTP